MRYLCSHCSGIVTGEAGAEQECPHCKEKAVAPAHSTDPGAVIGDFAIIRELGRGGVGIIFLARQISLDRQVALKILQKKFAENKEYIEGFFREARVAAQISHPNIVQAYAVGEDNGIYYFAMEFIDGCTMKHVLRQEGKIEPKRAAEIISEVADALDFAWTERQMVHQDIKPDNIMLTSRGKTKLADLGLARLASREVDFEDEDEVMGTPQYISPEQLTGVPTDVRSDIYSLGATFYHLVTGQFPYTGKDGNEIARQHVYGTFVPPKDILPELPDELNRIITRMMEKQADSRYQSAGELRDELKRFLSGRAAAPKLNIGGLKTPKVSAPPKISAPKQEAPSAPPKISAPKQEAPSAPPPKMTAPAFKPAPPPVVEAAKPVMPEVNEPEKAPETDVKSVPLPVAKKEEAPKPERNPISRKKLLLLILVPVSLLVVAGLLAGGVFAALRYKKGPEKYRLRALEILRLEQKEDGTLAFKAPEKKQEPTEEKKAETAKPAAPQVPPPPPKPKSRPELIAGVDTLLAALRNRMPEQEFLDKADAFYAAFAAGAQTEEEQKKLALLVEPFGRIDERLRVAPSRRKLRAEQERRSRALQEEEDRVKREAAEREAQLKKQAEEQRQLAQKLAEEAAANERRNREEARKRLAEIQAKIADERRMISFDFVRIARICDMYEWGTLLSAWESRVKAIPVADAGEKKLAAELLAFGKNLNGEMAVCAKIRELYFTSGQISRITMELSGSRLATAVKLDGNTLIMSASNEPVQLNILNANTRKAFIARAERRFKVKNSSFYLSIINGDFQYCTAATAPNAFMKKEINNLVKDYFSVAWSKANEAEKAEMRKEYGKNQIFKGVAR